MPNTVTTLRALMLLWVAGACGGPAPAASPRPAPAPAGAAAARARPPEAIGTSETLAARIVGVGFDPGRAVFELSQPAYVTLISVTETKIEAILPGDGTKQQIVAGGLHVASLRQLDSARFGVGDRFGARAGVLDNNISAGALQEYNRCVANARQADAQRRQAQRPIVGRDSAGRPVYGEAAPVADPREESERYCRMPAPRHETAAGGVQARAKGRYLLLYTSDTRIEYRDIVALAISEGDPRSMTEVIGRRLFGARGAQWSGSFVPF